MKITVESIKENEDGSADCNIYLDDETGKSHLAHAMCCLLFLLAFDLDKTLEKTNG